MKLFSKVFIRHFKIAGWNLPLLVLLYSARIIAQEEKVFTLKGCLDRAYEQNPQLKLAALEARYYQKVKPAAIDLPKTSVVYTQGQFNSIYPYDNNITIQQTIPYLPLLATQSGVARENVKMTNLRYKSAQAELTMRVKEAYFRLQHVIRTTRYYSTEDSIYRLLMDIESRNDGRTKDTLEFETTSSQLYLIRSHLVESNQDIVDARLRLQQLIRSETLPEVSLSHEDFKVLEADSMASPPMDHPLIQQMKGQIDMGRLMRRAEKNRLGPDIVVGYFNQSIYGPANIYGSDYFLTTANRLQGFQVGIAMPLYFPAHRARVAGATVRVEAAKTEYDDRMIELSVNFRTALNSYVMTRRKISYYERHLLRSAENIVTRSLAAFNTKKINYIEYLELMSRALALKRNYLQLILDNNLAVIQLEYLLGR
jgi:cobalt-zinc-cadmium resistance protein CzcA